MVGEGVDVAKAMVGEKEEMMDNNACEKPETEYRIPDDATGICYMGMGIGIDRLKQYLDVDFEQYKSNKREKYARLTRLADLVPGLVKALMYMAHTTLTCSMEYYDAEGSAQNTGVCLAPNQDCETCAYAQVDEALATARAAMEEAADENDNR